jgi:hypothetical protein
MSDGFDERGTEKFIPGKSKKFSLLHTVQIGFGANPSSYPICTEDSFPQE